MFLVQSLTSPFLANFGSTHGASLVSRLGTDDSEEDEHQVKTEAHEKFAKYCLFFIFIGRDVTQHILEYSTTYDLCARVRGVNRDFQSMVSTSNQWFARKLMPHRGVPDCVQVVRVMMHTYIYGKEIHEKALRMTKSDRKVCDHLFFDCATRLWYHENGTTSPFGDFPTMHEVNMTWCHGLENLSRRLFGLLLARLGLDEKNLSAKDRRKLRKMFLKYREELAEDGLRMTGSSAQSRRGSSFDWRWLDSIVDEGLSEKKDGKYPICFVQPSSESRERIGRQRIDPLVMMGALRNREMSRRFCRLFVDTDRTTPISDADLKEFRKCMKEYLLDVLTMGQEDDISFVKALMTNVRSESCAAFSPELVARTIIGSCRRLRVRGRVSIMNSLCGYDMDDAPEWKRQKLLFARALLPMCLSRIGESEVRASPRFAKALKALEPDGDENDALKEDLKRVFWSCF